MQTLDKMEMTPFRGVSWRHRPPDRMHLPSVSQPVKLVRYPEMFLRGKPMTIAIGMLHRDGVLVCADTLVTTPTVGGYESKIQAYRLRDGYAVFALSGNVPLAESAIQQCEETLRAGSNKPREKAVIASGIRAVLAKEYRTHVSSVNLIGTALDYSLIVAVRSDVDGMSLYSTAESVLVKSKRGLEYIGVGSEKAQTLLRPVYRNDLAYKRAWSEAAYAIGVIKREMPGYVGGDPIFLNLPSEGDVDVSGYAHAEHLERYTGRYDALSETLLSAFMDLDNDDRFRKILELFTKQVDHCRKEWQEKGLFRLFSGMREPCPVRRSGSRSPSGSSFCCGIRGRCTSPIGSWS